MLQRLEEGLARRPQAPCLACTAAFVHAAFSGPGKFPIFQVQLPGPEPEVLAAVMWVQVLITDSISMSA